MVEDFQVAVKSVMRRVCESHAGCAEKMPIERLTTFMKFSHGAITAREAEKNVNLVQHVHFNVSSVMA